MNTRSRIGGIVSALVMVAWVATFGAAVSACSTPPLRRADARFDATLSGYPYPHPVQTLELPFRESVVRMAYMDVKPAPGRANGRTVLLLHGKNFGAFYWARTIDLLTGAGFRVVAPDQVGFGKSDKPEDYVYSFAALATNTTAILDALGLKNVSVVGHSMGGMLATRFALMFPERTQSLVLVNPIGLEDWSAVVPYRSVDAWFEREKKATADSIRTYQRASYYDGNWTEEYEALIEAAAGQTKHPDHAKVAWASALTYDMVFTQPVVHDFPRLRVPTLLLIGQRDRTAIGKDAVPQEVAANLGDYPALGKAAASAIPGAKLVPLEGVGHVPQVEAWPEFSEELLRFLRTPTDSTSAN